MEEVTKTKPEIKGKDYYLAKGQVRLAMIVSIEQKDKLKAIADKWGVSQNAVIEVVLDHFPDDALSVHLQEKATSAVGAGRPSKGITQSAVAKELKGMTPEQLAAVAEALAKIKAV